MREILPRHHRCLRPEQENDQRGDVKLVSSSLGGAQQRPALGQDLCPLENRKATDLDAGAEVRRVVSVVVVVVSDSLAQLSGQPPLALLTQLEKKSTTRFGRCFPDTKEAAETHRAGGLEAELGQRLWGELEVCWQGGFPVGGSEGRPAVGCCCL